MNLADVDALYAAIGESQVSAQSIVQRLARELRGGEPEQLPTTATRGVRGPRNGRHSTAGVYVEGLDDVMVHLARCCTPVPGDQIIGFVTQGRGVSVHRADCSNATALARRHQERLIEVEWDRGGAGRLPGHARGAGLRPVAAARRREPGRLRAPPQHRRRPHRRPPPTGSAGWPSTSSWPTPRTCSRSSPRLKHLDGVFDAYRQLPGKKA